MAISMNRSSVFYAGMNGDQASGMSALCCNSVVFQLTLLAYLVNSIPERLTQAKKPNHFFNHYK
jgi:hypothetical protein